MTDGNDALGAPARAQAIDILKDYGALHAAVQRLIALGDYAKAYADPNVIPNPTVLELLERWHDHARSTSVAFAELVRLDAALAARRRALIGEPDPQALENLH